MTDKDIFEDMKEQMKPSPQTLSRLMTALEAEEAAPDPPVSSVHTSATGRNRDRIRRLYGLVAAAVFVVLIISEAFLIGNILSGVLHPDPGAELVAQAGEVQAPGDYDELYATIDELTSSRKGILGSVFSSDASGAAVEDTAALAPLATQETADSPSSYKAAAEGDYTETNVQVEGIDEGDIVKTDGSYLYVLSNNELIIFKADGGSTKELSRILVAAVSDENSWHNASELYLSGDTVVIIGNEYRSGFATDWGEDVSEKMLVPYEQDWTTAAFFDVSDPANPVFLRSFGQSGSYSSSRLEGDVLYLISRYWLSNSVDKNEPVSFVPLLREGDSAKVMAIDDIRIMPSVQEVNYAVVSSLNVKSVERIDQKSVLGSADTVYMSYNNLYLGSTVYSEEVKEPYQESVYTVEEHIGRQMTQLIRIGVDLGTLDVAAQCTIEGSLLNQFSLDEYEGNLRLVMTRSNNSYKILKDASHDVEVWQPLEDNLTTNALYVLNPALEIIGSITGLAKDEQIYSARFAGPTGYMVTYRQMDPLFAIDLSNPAAPKVTSELKIPGFSTYLHPFGEGRLLGLGYNADGAIRENMKLSMFDISDPFDVTELVAMGVDATYSEALDNHKAVLVDTGRTIIGFAGEASSSPVYFVYSYDDEAGFVLLSTLELSSSEEYYSGSYGTRGFVIGENLYVCSNASLDVFGLEGFEKKVSLKIQDNNPLYAETTPYRIE